MAYYTRSSETKMSQDVSGFQFFDVLWTSKVNRNLSLEKMYWNKQK